MGRIWGRGTEGVCGGMRCGCRLGGFGNEMLEKKEVKFIIKLFSIKKLIILSGHFAIVFTIMDLENIMLRGTSQMEEDKNPMISLMWDIKQKAANEQTNNKYS